MNTDELVNNLLPLLQAKLNAPTTNTLEGLSHPQREKSQANDSRPPTREEQLGDLPPQKQFKKWSASRDSTQASRHTQSKESSKTIPSPTTVSSGLRKLTLNSSPSFQQRLEFLETTDISSEASPEFRDEIVNKLQEVLALNFHAAQGVRIERRIALAKSIKWNNSLIEACEKVDSSAEGDTELFGPEFRERFHAEAKNWKHHRYLNAVQQSHQPRGGYVRGRGRGRGRGCFTQLGKSDGRTSYGGAKIGGKGYGGGTSGNATSDN
ncbi:hypothetical protein Unana1_08506 [Umbelopsis nana]